MEDVAAARDSPKEAMSHKEAGSGMIRSGISTTGIPGIEDEVYVGATNCYR